MRFLTFGSGGDAPDNVTFIGNGADSSGQALWGRLGTVAQGAESDVAARYFNLPE